MLLPSLSRTSKDLEDTLALEVCEDKIFLDLTPSSCGTQNEKNYPDLLKYLFACVEALNHQKNSKCLVLDITSCTVRHFYWNHLVDYLTKNLNVFGKIDLLDFAESSFSLRQLLDFYQLFKKCQEEKIKFPKTAIEMSAAGIQLTRSTDIREDKRNKLLEKDLRDSMGSKICPALDDLNEALLDIRREEFLEGITKDNTVDEIFFQHLWLSDESLYDYWKKQGWII